MDSIARRILIPVTCALLTLSASAFAAGNSSEAIAVSLRDKAMSADTVSFEFLSELTTRYGARPAGSPSEQAAAAWAAKKLTALGFSNVRIENFPMAAWVRGEERVELVSPHLQRMVAAALGGSPGTPKGGVEGDVVVFQTFDDLKAAAVGSLKGKIAMVNARMVRTQNGDGYGPVVAARALGPNEAAKRGAVAFVLRSVGTDNHRMPHVGATRFTDGRVLIPAFALAAPDADQIERLIALGATPRVRLFSTASYDTKAHSQNVIADIPGSEKPNEIVLLGAHLDSWDLGTGAIDDAAGCAIITAAAKLIGEASRKPKRTVRVVLFGSEEVSQPTDTPLGGPSYLNAHKAEVPNHVLTGESDFGADRIYAVSLPKHAASTDFGKTVLRVLQPIGVLASSVPPGEGGADVEPLVTAGVPAFLLHQDGTRYFDLHHTADDTLDKVDPAQLSQNVAAWAALAWLAADSDFDFRNVPEPPAAAP